MGWWATEDGTGSIGDRPADVLGALLTGSLGERLDRDLLAGFLAAVGGAVLRDPARLVADPPRPGDAILAELDGAPPLTVPVAAPLVETGLDDAAFAALEDASFCYREGGPERLPTWAELLETVAFVARGRLTDADVTRIRPVTAPSAPPGWVETSLALVAAARASRPQVAARIDIPPEGDGLRDADRRALLALRDLATQTSRPVHPDPAVAAARAALAADVRAAVDGTALPGPDSPAFVLTAVLDPAGARASGRLPEPWRAWV